MPLQTFWELFKKALISWFEVTWPASGRLGIERRDVEEAGDWNELAKIARRVLAF